MRKNLRGITQVSALFVILHVVLKRRRPLTDAIVTGVSLCLPESHRVTQLQRRLQALWIDVYGAAFLDLARMMVAVDLEGLAVRTAVLPLRTWQQET